MNNRTEIQANAQIVFAGLVCCASVALALMPTYAQNSATPDAPAASSQNTAAPPASAPATSSSSTAEPDLSITANVTARELRFDAVPNPRVDFTGRPERETVWDAARRNLPRPVQPGVTYRDIGIQLKITSVFADIDRIVAEALGEVPVTDTAPPPQLAPNAPPEAPVKPKGGTLR